MENKCPKCGGDITTADVDYQEYDEDYERMITYYHCHNCDHTWDG